MADRRRRFEKEEVLTYAYILLYIALSSGQIFFNKVRFSFSIRQISKLLCVEYIEPIRSTPFGC